MLIVLKPGQNLADAIEERVGFPVEVEKKYRHWWRRRMSLDDYLPVWDPELKYLPEYQRVELEQVSDDAYRTLEDDLYGKFPPEPE